jgi:TolB-like protein
MKTSLNKLSMCCSFIFCFLFVSISLSPSLLFGADNVRISVSDFQVQSDNLQYKYLGKGFAEFISTDISKAPNIDLIARERRTEALKEQAISQTGLIDEGSQIKIGKMLAAKYIVFGNIFDLAGNLSITYKVMDTSTGKVIFQDKINGKLANFEYLSAAISQKILNSFTIAAPDSVIAKAEKSSEKAENAAIDFSNAMNAYDNNDISHAKKDLDKAAELDPDNESIRAYLRKLVLNTAKFKTVTQEYFPNQNPAYLGLIQFDKVFFSGACIMYNETETNTTKSDYKQFRGNAGYQFPLWSSIGVSVEALALNTKNNNKANNGTTATDITKYFGGIISLGYLLNDYISLGGSLTLYEQMRSHTFSGTPSTSDENNKFRTGGTLGFLIKNRESTLIFDSIGGYSNQMTISYNRKTSQITNEAHVPYYNENTFTLGLFDRRMFIVMKEINNYYRDNDAYVGRIVPAVEYWFLNWMSLRGGVEGSYAHQSNSQDNNKTGIGWIGGLSLRSLDLGIDFDLTYTYRSKPIMLDGGDCDHESIVYFTLSKSNLFISR